MVQGGVEAPSLPIRGFSPAFQGLGCCKKEDCTFPEVSPRGPSGKMMCPPNAPIILPCIRCSLAPICRTQGIRPPQDFCSVQFARLCRRNSALCVNARATNRGSRSSPMRFLDRIRQFEARCGHAAKSAVTSATHHDTRNSCGHRTASFQTVGKTCG